MDSSDDDFMCCEGDEMQSFNYLCLMCQNNFADIESMTIHISQSHKVNLKSILKSANLSSEYDWIKIVNFLRKNKDNINVEDIANGIWQDDSYLIPQIQDDNLLFIDYKTVIDSPDNDEFANLQVKVSELENQISLYEETISKLRLKVTELLDCEADASIPAVVTTTIDSKMSNLNAEDNAYFSSYSHYSIHDTMIKDTVRTESYRKFIEDNGSKYFKDKIVLDVGCGTGILSMFAARSGAAHVYGVDCADIIYDAMAIVEKNGLKNKITLIHGKLEETRLPCAKVDIVISEWMGYFLIYESMLDSVLFACRQYLDPRDGLVFPRYFTLNVVGAEMSAFRSKNVNCWDSVFGFDMGCMKMNVTKEVIVEVVPNDEIITEPFLIRDYDVQAMAFDANSVCPQLIEQRFELSVNRTGKIGAIVAYFDTYFLASDADKSEQVMFSTGSHATSTHWQQTVLLLNQELAVTEGQVVRGNLIVGRHSHGKRGLTFSLTIDDHAHQNYEFS